MSSKSILTIPGLFFFSDLPSQLLFYGDIPELSPCQIKTTEATGLTNMKGFKVVEIVFFDYVNEFCHFIGGGILLMGVVVVVIQFLSGVVPFAEMAGFTPFLLQLLALRPSTCCVSGHPPSSNQSSLCPLPLPPGLLRSSSLSLATHFKIQSNLQNTIVIPPQHMSIPSNSICCC